MAEDTSAGTPSESAPSRSYAHMSLEETMRMLPSSESANPWRPCFSTLLDRDNKMLDLGDGTKISLESVEFKDLSTFPHTSWRRKAKAEGDDPPHKEIILLDPEALSKSQFELAHSCKGGYTSKPYNDKRLPSRSIRGGLLFVTRS